MADVESLLDDAIAIVDGVGLAWAVMGGCARNAYAEPRATRDVDLVVEALARRKRLAPFGRTQAHVVSIEDLIVYKLIADRPQDRADIAAVVAAHGIRGEPIDWPYIETWCDAWDVCDRLNALRADSGA